MSTAITRTDAKRALQIRQREWLRQVVIATGEKPTQIARKSGVSDTTLTRLLNNPEYSGTLSEVTVERIKATYNLPGPEISQSKGPGLIIAEAERIDAHAVDQSTAQALAALASGHLQVEFWRLNSSSLEGAGYLAGDVVIVDTQLPPGPHDAVKAVVTEWNRGGTETVWRIFDPPFLTASTARGTGSKPLLVDGQRVKVEGVIVAYLRPHRHASTAS